jgi:hypothetical protein
MRPLLTALAANFALPIVPALATALPADVEAMTPRVGFGAVFHISTPHAFASALHPATILQNSI